jgi:hypothetical protein
MSKMNKIQRRILYGGRGTGKRISTFFKFLEKYINQISIDPERFDNLFSGDFKPAKGDNTDCTNYQGKE